MYLLQASLFHRPKVWIVDSGIPYASAVVAIPSSSHKSNLVALLPTTATESEVSGLVTPACGTMLFDDSV